MDQNELERMVQRHDEALRALGGWVLTTQDIVKSLFDKVRQQREWSIATAEFLKELKAAHDLSQEELSKLHRLDEQFEAVQEMFGQRLARALEMNFPPLFSVVPGGKEET